MFVVKLFLVLVIINGIYGAECSDDSSECLRSEILKLQRDLRPLTSSIPANTQQYLPFGALESDWTRLLQLESLLPVGHRLRRQLTRAFLLLVQAVRQALEQELGADTTTRDLATMKQVTEKYLERVLGEGLFAESVTRAGARMDLDDDLRFYKSDDGVLESDRKNEERFKQYQKIINDDIETAISGGVLTNLQDEIGGYQGRPDESVFQLNRKSGENFGQNQGIVNDDVETAISGGALTTLQDKTGEYQGRSKSDESDLQFDRRSGKNFGQNQDIVNYDVETVISGGGVSNLQDKTAEYQDKPTSNYMIKKNLEKVLTVDEEFSRNSHSTEDIFKKEDDDHQTSEEDLEISPSQRRIVDSNFDSSNLDHSTGGVIRNTSTDDEEDDMEAFDNLDNEENAEDFVQNSANQDENSHTILNDFKDVNYRTTSTDAKEENHGNDSKDKSQNIDNSYVPNMDLGKTIGETIKQVNFNDFNDGVLLDIENTESSLNVPVIRPFDEEDSKSSVTEKTQIHRKQDVVFHQESTQISIEEELRNIIYPALQYTVSDTDIDSVYDVKNYAETRKTSTSIEKLLNTEHVSSETIVPGFISLEDHSKYLDNDNYEVLKQVPGKIFDNTESNVHKDNINENSEGHMIHYQNLSDFYTDKSVEGEVLEHDVSNNLQYGIKDFDHEFTTVPHELIVEVNGELDNYAEVPSEDRDVLTINKNYEGNLDVVKSDAKDINNASFREAYDPNDKTVTRTSILNTSIEETIEIRSSSENKDMKNESEIKKILKDTIKKKLKQLLYQSAKNDSGVANAPSKIDDIKTVKVDEGTKDELGEDIDKVDLKSYPPNWLKTVLFKYMEEKKKPTKENNQDIGKLIKHEKPIDFAEPKIGAEMSSDGNIKGIQENLDKNSDVVAENPILVHLPERDTDEIMEFSDVSNPGELHIHGLDNQDNTEHLAEENDESFKDSLVLETEESKYHLHNRHSVDFNEKGVDFEKTEDGSLPVYDNSNDNSQISGGNDEIDETNVYISDHDGLTVYANSQADDVDSDIDETHVNIDEIHQDYSIPIYDSNEKYFVEENSFQEHDDASYAYAKEDQSKNLRPNKHIQKTLAEESYELGQEDAVLKKIEETGTLKSPEIITEPPLGLKNIVEKPKITLETLDALNRIIFGAMHDPANKDKMRTIEVTTKKIPAPFKPLDSHRYIPLPKWDPKLFQSPSLALPPPPPLKGLMLPPAPRSSRVAKSVGMMPDANGARAEEDDLYRWFFSKFRSDDAQNVADKVKRGEQLPQFEFRGARVPYKVGNLYSGHHNE